MRCIGLLTRSMRGARVDGVSVVANRRIIASLPTANLCNT